ncbi:MAG: hypothetical protein KatS3mg110_1297 [Pirellulaceae bacterium]|nr:MAG: hypothetical protein KatS3mg110_1297 [Pirellulaceae bacterium]
MTEGMKTLTAAGLALLVAVIALVTRPKDQEFTADEVRKQVQKPLFPDFTDPAAAARLEIVKVNQDVGQLTKFEVARDKKTDLWIIPSHNGYPADAENQMRDVSLLFIDMKILDIASMVPEDHALYGVVEPTEENASSASGVGTLVTVEDRDGDKLANLIIGKPVKNSMHNEHFVRRPGQDIVYVVSIDPSKLSTRFEDWIEKDLLKLNSWDIADIRVQDYSLVPVEPGVFRPDHRLDVKLKWDSSKGQWTLDQYMLFRRGQPVPAQMAEGEELNTTKLNDLKNALDDLQIVDVFRKPKGMGADLRADRGFLNDAESVQSLIEKGFYPLARNNSEKVELLSANGEIHVGMNDGVEYILRFGNTVKDPNSDKLNRFLFVMARFDESRFPMPEKPAILANPAPQPTASDKPAQGAESGAAGAEANGTETSSGGMGQQGNDKQNEQPSDTNQQPSSQAGSGEQKGDTTSGTASQENEEQAAERQKAEKEYQRKLDERDEKIKKAQQRVRELNNRFADWYYVISEDMYRKIHLSRSDIFRAKTGTTEEGFGIDAFRALEKEGLKK